MIKARHSTLIIFSGLVWLAIGFFLCSIGLNFIVKALLKENILASKPILGALSPYLGSLDAAALALVIVSFIIGLMKGNFIFSKSVERGVKHIRGLSNPAPISQIYPKKYYILLGSMFLISFLVKFAPLDIRGAIDLAVGVALIQGSVLYFKAVLSKRQVT